MKNCLLLLVSILFHKFSFSQVEIGSWRSHLPAKRFQYVDHMHNRIFGANSSGVIVYDTDDESIEFLSKINVLVDAGISAFKCSEENSVCVIGYQNGNLDIITSDLSVFNQPALKNNFIVGSKSINDILFQDNYALISTGIGFLKLDLKTFNINADRKESINDDRLQVLKAYVQSDSVIFSTQKGIFKCPLESVFEGGEFTPVGFNLEPTFVNQFYSINNQLYLTYRIDTLYEGDSIYSLHGNSFERINWLAGAGIKHVETSSDSIYVTGNDNISIFNLDLEPLANIYTYGNDIPLNPSEAIPYGNKQVLIADLTNGISITSIDNQFNPTLIGISSPSAPSNTILNQLGNKIIALPGGNEFTYNNPLVHVFDENEWISYDLTSDTYNTLRNTNGLIQQGDDYFISTEKVGIAETNKSFEVQALYDYTNSTIQDAEPNIPYDYCGITDMVSANGNLYALNNKVPNPLIIRTQDGQWLSTQFSELPSPKTGDILATSSGFLVLNMIDVGIIVYNTKNTADDLTDDEYRLLTTSPTSGNLPSGNVTCFELDKDGELWIGTDAGIGIIYSLESVFNSNFDGAQQIIVNQDGYNGYLFETETVEAIAIDGANRKWIGTSSSGLFLISADGQDQIHNFTIENSPLLSNKVSDLAIHPISGEVFIASENGLISYRSDATEGVSSTEELIPFPNPVKPGYNGQIAIKNLAENSYVRITDQAGNLIYETTSLGGQAVWDGKNRDGKPVTSGVYLVFANGGIGNRGQTGKIMIFR